MKSVIATLIMIIVITFAPASEWRSVPINGGLVHGLTIGDIIAEDDEKIVSNIMVNAISGEVDSIQGIAVGGIFNRVNYGMNGISAAGIINITDGYMGGVQAAGIINIAGSLNGSQVAGISNFADSVIGIQAAGISNSTNFNFGFQLAGIVNKCDGSSQGAQIAGVYSSAHDIEGAQLSGIHNSAKNVYGTQIAGISSIADSVSGVQISSIFNVASTVTGLQIGLINIADKNDGASIGLLSIDKSNPAGLMAWTDEQLFINTGIRTGSRKLYNLLFISVRPDEKPYFSIGAGLGKRYRLSDNLSLDFDATAQYILQQKELNSLTFNDYFQQRIRLFADYRIFREFGIYAGPTFNTTVSKSGERLALLSDRTSYHRRNWNSYETVLTPGFVVGIRIN